MHDTTNAPHGDSDRVIPEPRNSVSVLPTTFPEVGEQFSIDHFLLIKEFVMPRFRALLNEYPELGKETPFDELVDRTVHRAIRAGPVNSNACALLRTIVEKVKLDAIRKMARRHALNLFSLDQLEINDLGLIDCNAEPVDAVTECDATQVAAGILLWVYPDSDPQAVALLSIWLVRANSRMSLRRLAELSPGHRCKLNAFYQEFKKTFHVPAAQRLKLWEIVREREADLILPQVHFYYAAGCKQYLLGAEIEKLHRVMLECPRFFGEYLDHVRQRARENSACRHQMWRDTEELYAHNKRIVAGLVAQFSEMM